MCCLEGGDAGAGGEHIPTNVIRVVRPAKIERCRRDSRNHLISDQPQQRVQRLPGPGADADVFVVDDVIREIIVVDMAAPVPGIRVGLPQLGHARAGFGVPGSFPGDPIQLVGPSSFNTV